MRLGCIADDFTGASDVAGILARAMPTALLVGVPANAAPACEAAVVALKTRSVPAEEAVRRSLDALRWLRARGCGTILFKYCSTFDSTPSGNIGPVAEALAGALDARAVVVCPAYPEASRTVYQGHLFVHDRLLSESGMEHHPLTPMTDPDLRRWLRRQTTGEIGFVPHAVTRRGETAVREALRDEAAGGRVLVVVDAITDDDLRAIGAAVADAPLVTGASGVAFGLAAALPRARHGPAPAFDGVAGPGAVLSGSCSATSLAQLAHHLARHEGMAVDAAGVISGAVTVGMACRFVLSAGEAPIVYASADAAALRDEHATFGRARAAAAIEAFLGALAVALVGAGVRRLVVAGGETSGAVVEALGVNHLMVGPEIDPAVPVLAGEARGVPVRLALKSGNFGRDDFHARALRSMSAR